MRLPEEVLRIPPGARTPGTTRTSYRDRSPAMMSEVLLAVTAGARSVREVLAALGCHSFRQVHEALLQLRAEGLVAWEDERAGTLRPGVRFVAIAPEVRASIHRRRKASPSDRPPRSTGKAQP